jgi:hypothetical protein
MATRSTIGYETADGGYVGVYCHYDGYPDNIGPSLDEMLHADVIIMVEQALRNGGMRCLDAPNTFQFFNENSERERWLVDEWPSCPEEWSYRKRLNGQLEIFSGEDAVPWMWNTKETRQ